ncbi:MAG: DNA replication/repair protein RecF [Pseudomonadota bacterium]
MPLTRLDITDFRNLAAITLEPLVTGFNFLYGMNGSGKTSLLEAIYYLSVGRSFRNCTSGRIIRHSTDKLLIFAHKKTNNDQYVTLGLERKQHGALKIRIANKDAQSIAELASLLPVQLMNASCYSLLEGGPAYRRKFLDWGNFYLHVEFLRVWQDYNQALTQRNAALRNGQPQKELVVWNQMLTEKAQRLDQLRQDFVNLLIPQLKTTVAELISLPGLELYYQRGWDEGEDYAAVLAASLDKDRYMGYTQFGPHRADFKMKINQVDAKDILSRGQQKLFVYAMILAQGALLHRCTNKKPIYLIDDLPAELDIVSRNNLITLLSRQETQIFVTAVEREALSENLCNLPVKMFHVEHGNVRSD